MFELTLGKTKTSAKNKEDHKKKKKRKKKKLNRRAICALHWIVERDIPRESCFERNLLARSHSRQIRGKQDIVECESCLRD
jgi:hypothetical protein